MMDIALANSHSDVPIFCPGKVGTKGVLYGIMTARVAAIIQFYIYLPSLAADPLLSAICQPSGSGVCSAARDRAKERPMGAAAGAT